MKKTVKGSFTKLDGKDFYKIENYDCMDDFFMTITSSSDIWNFCWSKGGVTAGRINCDHAIFPYYTADKVSDAKSYTGPFTSILVEGAGKAAFDVRSSGEGSTSGGSSRLWEPFAALSAPPAARAILDKGITRNIYKNTSGTCVWFEEINSELELSFRYCWTSSAKFGLVRKSVIENLGSSPVSLKILDGCQNILPACVTADFQNNNSVLLDAYKKSDFDKDSKLAIFAVSSIVTDKAEPSEGLFANTCWFSTDDDVILSPEAPKDFAEAALTGAAMPQAQNVLKGKWASAFICREVKLGAKAGASSAAEGNANAGQATMAASASIETTSNLGKSAAHWYQVFDTKLDHSRIAALKTQLADRTTLTAALEKDIADGEALMDTYISEADGLQSTADKMTCTHHADNVMFNIMRGGFFANQGKINLEDFVAFVSQRNKAQVEAAAEVTKKLTAAASENPAAAATKKLPASASTAASARAGTATNSPKVDAAGFATYSDVETAVLAKKNPQLSRLFYEYMPLTFSRRHGDPSRPWNRFNIKLRDEKGNPILNYEGNWRDIFQNWEALAWSYPKYIKNMTAKFLNAMTIDGFNPYHISREGLDWEIPDPDNPWAQIGYWGDHQVIYLEKLLEFYSKTDRVQLLSSLDDKIYASANVPYRIKTYKEIEENPRNSINFDRALSQKLQENAKKYGSDAKLIQTKDGNVAHTSLTAKLLQIVIAKAANFIPGGGIWLNTQRPEWNDANNALAGYGLSMVTTYYLYRFLNFLLEMFEDSRIEAYTLPKVLADCFAGLGKLFQTSDIERTAADAPSRKAFAQTAGLIFEKERNVFYAKGYNDGESQMSKKEVTDILKSMQAHIAHTIAINKRADGLFHSYNTMKITEKGMEIEYLQEMLEGQVAVLSAGILEPAQALDLLKALRASKIYEERQNSYMLYPNKELPDFLAKNTISKTEAEKLAKSANGDLGNGNLLEKSLAAGLLNKDSNGNYHFNGEFRNARFLSEYLDSLTDTRSPAPATAAASTPAVGKEATGAASDTSAPQGTQTFQSADKSALLSLYEKTFNHQSFTGRSGTFYAYEGLGSIYWHMVSKLLLAVQENLIRAQSGTPANSAASSENQAKADPAIIQGLAQAYYDVRSGIGFNKEPELYGAFPADPYSHTPSGQGAKQPGMTGQVKEEVLTRWGELGLTIERGIASFNPSFLKKSEFFDDGTLSFTWCGAKIIYHLAKDESEKSIRVNGGATKTGNQLTAEETAKLFNRDGSIQNIDVAVYF